MRSILVADVGSTTTKAILFRDREGWEFLRREAPTTVEAPHEDVTVGLLAALRHLEAEAGMPLVRDDSPAVPLLATSSAGGGLAMVVTGLMKAVTSLSAERAALGAGAVLLDTVALDDGRVPYRKVQALQDLRPDMLLLAGGFDGDALTGPVLLSELVRQAALHPKLDREALLPVLFAGNRHACELVRETLGDRYLFRSVPNLRPASDEENLEPARAAIHEIFMEHVMSHAPGYPALTRWVDAPILPTPSAFSRILGLASARLDARILAVDIGGATTDVFTADGGEVSRTVSANLGMSYSALNVADLAGIEAVRELIGFEITAETLLTRIGNKLLDPTSLPATEEAVEIERAVAAVAIRLAVEEHVAVLEGRPISRSEEELSLRSIGRKQRTRKDARAGLEGYDLVIGSGGILSHSPRAAALSMLMNALDPVGAPEFAVDRAFMFPHLGVLSTQDEELAVRLFLELGLVRLATVVGAGGTAKSGRGGLTLTGDGGELSAPAGEVAFHETAAPGTYRVRARKLGFPGKTVDLDGKVVLDARGRPPLARGLRLIPAGFEPPPARERMPPGPQVRDGPVRVRRELALDGEVLVSIGDEVGSDTMVARCTRTFPRPFFLRPAETLEVVPAELAEHLLRGIGEEISAGEVLAERTAGMGTRLRFKSPVTGTVERILPNGTVVVREREETPAGCRSVEAALDLDMDCWRIGPYLRVVEGQEVEAGQQVARVLRGTAYAIAVSPIRGVVRKIDVDSGIVLIAPLAQELEVTAWLPGTVEEVTERGAIVAATGTTIRGAWGWGAEAAGPLSMDEARDGHVVVLDAADQDTLARLTEAKVAGLVTGGMDLAEVREAHPPFPVVLTEGFGPRGLPAQVRSALEAHAGRLALVDATTELRVGVRRPVVVLYRDVTKSTDSRGTTAGERDAIG